MNHIVKIISSCLLASLLCLTVSCGGPKEGDAKSVASDFLTAYFAGQYDSLSVYCTDTLAGALNEAIGARTFESDEVASAVAEMSKNTKVTVGEVIKGEDKAVCTVPYEISLPDSSLVKKVLVLNKIDGIWKVASLN